MHSAVAKILQTFVATVTVGILPLQGDNRKGQTTPSDGQYYLCPLYSSPSVRDCITCVPLRTTVQPDHWRLRGVALFSTGPLAHVTAVI